jgi:hypothetical protein
MEQKKVAPVMNPAGNNNNKELEFATDMLNSLTRQVMEKTAQLARADAKNDQMMRDVEQIRMQLSELQSQIAAQSKPELKAVKE